MVNQKEIVLLPYPFSSLKENKIRPALIISNNKFNRKSKDCIMVPLTAVIKDEPYSILINQKDLFSGNLIRPSRIRADKIFSVEKNLIKMRIGIINNKVLRSVKKEISKMF